LERDVTGLSGVSAVIWLEGINDLGAKAEVEAIQDGMKEVVGRIRSAIPRVRVIGATVTSAMGNTGGSHGSEQEETKRQALNRFIREGGLFDGVADFDKATVDPQSGAMRPEFVPDSTIGGPGDKLHPNRAGYLAMAEAIDLKLLLE
jgi:lysophospholipase L1-like esterase